MNFKDEYKKRLKAFLNGYLKAGIVVFLFYRSVKLTLIMSVIYGFINIKTDMKKRKEEWKWKLNLEFREVMSGIAASLNAGYSIENAFTGTLSDLKLLYGEQSVMVSEIEIMNTKLKLSQSLEDILMDFAKQSDVEDIYNFAEVFQTAKKTGGDLIAVAHTTAERIGGKIEVNREIRTMIAGKQMEGKIMDFIPLGIIAYFWLCSPGFLDCLYTETGRPVMTILLIVYLAAHKWIERIGRIAV